MKKAFISSYKSAFSLVELSIVLVILGLLVGGVLSGRSLIRAAELRSVSTEYQRYVTALTAFRDKFFGLPGDFKSAQNFWADEENGDGNNMIIGYDPTDPATNETGHFWSQLARAGLIEGSYTPADWTSATVDAGGKPKAKLGNASWNIRWTGIVNVDDESIGTSGAGNNIVFEGNYRNAFYFMSGVNLEVPSGGVLKAEEAWNIDTKLDDGKPATGMVLSLESQAGAAGAGGCSSPAGDVVSLAASVYEVNGTSGTACSLVFKSGR